jgi:hypothetical protein
LFYHPERKEQKYSEEDVISSNQIEEDKAEATKNNGNNHF